MKTRHLVAFGTLLLVGAGAATLLAPNDKDRTAVARSQAAVALAQSAPRPDSIVDTKVWAVGETRLYHCPEEAPFGRVAGGEMMSEFDANARGMRPATGRPCR